MTRPPALLQIYAALDSMHAWRGWHWWPDADPFEVCVGAILVQNTMWANVELALARLREANALNHRAMSALPVAELEELVRPSGQYRQKARKLRAFLVLVQEAGGIDALLASDPTALRAQLLATWGIGPETADCVLCYAASQPALVIDAYTMRLLGRLRLGPASASYGEWQRWMLAAIEAEAPSALPGPARRELYARFHALIVLHCKHLCRKNAPGCAECELQPACSFANQPLG